MQKLSPKDFLDVVAATLNNPSKPTWMPYRDPETFVVEFYVRADGIPLQGYMSPTPQEMGEEVYEEFVETMTGIINAYIAQEEAEESDED